MRPRGINSNNTLTTNNPIVATRTPSRINSPLVRSISRNDKFIFDAPQFEDFTKPTYQIQKRFLEEIVLPKEQRSNWVVEEVKEEIIDDFVDESWFQREHKEHEPTSPFTPAGPLITPESNAYRNSISSICTPLSRLTYQGSPLSSSTKPSSVNSNKCANSIATPQTPGPSKLGLRAKPIRILQSNLLQSSVSSRTSSIGSVNLHTFYPEMTEIKSPTRRRISTTSKWEVTSILEADPKRDKSPLTQTGLKSSRRESGKAPPSTGWSSIPETPPILASGLIFDEENTPLSKKRSLVEASPFVPAKDFDFSMESLTLVAPRRMGLTTRALRVPATLSSSLKNDEIMDSIKSIIPSMTSKKETISPPVKRVKVDARFCPAPPPMKSRNASPEKVATTTLDPPPASSKIPPPPKKEKPVKIDDLKKMLAEHNQKLRPHLNNITRRR